MNHVYAGEPDARQSADPTMPTSRFRPRYRALSDEEKALHDAIKTKAAELEALFERAYDLRCPPPVLEAIAVSADDVVGELVLGDPIVVHPFKRDPKGNYFIDGLKHLELAVMWTVKGLTA